MSHKTVEDVLRKRRRADSRIIQAPVLKIVEKFIDFKIYTVPPLAAAFGKKLTMEAGHFCPRAGGDAAKSTGWRGRAEIFIFWLSAAGGSC